jgi:hypothetical protein
MIIDTNIETLRKHAQGIEKSFLGQSMTPELLIEKKCKLLEAMATLNLLQDIKKANQTIITKV